MPKTWICSVVSVCTRPILFRSCSHIQDIDLPYKWTIFVHNRPCGDPTRGRDSTRRLVRRWGCLVAAPQPSGRPAMGVAVASGGSFPFGARWRGCLWGRPAVQGGVEMELEARDWRDRKPAPVRISTCGADAGATGCCNAKQPSFPLSSRALGVHEKKPTGSLGGGMEW